MPIIYNTVIKIDSSGVKEIKSETGEEVGLLRSGQGESVNYESFPEKYREIVENVLKQIDENNIKNTALEIKITSIDSF